MKKFTLSIVCPSLCMWLLCIVFNGYALMGQSTVRGVVSDHRNLPVPYANVAIYGTYEGAVTDDSGRFELKTSLAGKVKLTVTSIGFESANTELELNNREYVVRFELKEEYASLSPAMITAGIFAAGEKGKAELFKPRDIVTTAGTPGDIQATIESLPGTQRVGYTEGLFVRGGSGKESKYIMDGMIYPNPYYSNIPSLKQRGRIDPYLFSGTIFSAGGYSAQYGQALSSVLILNSKGIADSSITGGGIHNLGGNIFHTHRWKKVSLNTNVYYNDLRLHHRLSRLNTAWTESPVNKELRLVFRYKPGKKNLLKVYADLSGTSSGIRFNHAESPDPVNFTIKNSNFIINANYTTFFNNERSSLFTGISLSHNDDRIRFGGKPMRQSDGLGQGKIMFRHSFTNDMRILAGAEYIRTDLFGRSDTLHSSVVDNLLAIFAETEATIKGKFALRAGLRSEYSAYSGNNITPRTSFAYKFSKTSQVSLSYGIFCQLPDKTDMLFNPYGLSSEKANHYIFNYQYQLNDRTLRAELYLKQYNRLVSVYTPQVNVPASSGYARGFELFYRDRASIANLDWWISYSYTNSKRKSILAGELVTPDYVSTHSLSLVGKYWFSDPGLLFSTSCSYATPRNYTGMDEVGQRFDLEIPAFYSIDISVSKPLMLLHRPAMLFCSWQNLTGYDKILGYIKLPAIDDPVRIYRSEKRSFFIGLFISMYND